MWGRAASVVLTMVFVSACGTGDDPTVAVPVSSDQTTITAALGRMVPAPADGALRVRVPPPGDALAAGQQPDDVLLFGDSVAVLVADELAAASPARLHVDGVDCRRLDLAFSGPCGGVPAGTTVGTGLDALGETVDALEDEGIRLDAAVLIIANNAALDADDLDEAMDILASAARVWWVTTDVEGRGWRDPNNALLSELAERDERAGVIDWFAAGQDRDWRADHVHPNEAGQAAMADLVADHLRCDCTP